ncbi:hypothetical protein MET9862_02559 [Methylobacterium symbioticum]|uniref:Uncharacterized protein n=1 Tax=Methylobacterium symbioticum TaxID=2584084 RepID=A0A509ECH8_9HYPH|nr:hypothetical protein MET9862_02559 [Methylobacterium symbioticum]
MSRNRVRRSFTVETKARGRQAPAFLPVRAALLENKSERSAARLFEAAPASGAERPEPRRILPSLVPPPVAEPEPVAVESAEAPLPRVRRVAVRQAAPKAEAAPKAPSRSAKVKPAAVIEVPPATPVASVQPALPSQPETAERASRRSRREGEDLRLGERWKRRLPRVCW